jgi:DNA-binding transcriptional MerR regulator
MKAVYEGLGAAVMRGEARRDRRDHGPHGVRTKQTSAKPVDSPYPMSTAEVATHIGATLRQLQWWSEQGMIRAEVKSVRTGVSRIWTPEAVRLAKLVADLRRKGISCQLARRVIAHVAKTFDLDLYRLPAAIYVLTDGRKIATASEPWALQSVVDFAGKCAVVRIEP